MPKTQQTPASVLNSLLEEYQLNHSSLSMQIGLSVSSVRQIAAGKSGISVPTALRLAKFFGQCPSFWLDLQLQTDMQKAANDEDLQSALKEISKVKKPAAPPKGKPLGKNKKENTLAEKRKTAAKAPDSRAAAKKQVKKEVNKK